MKTLFLKIYLVILIFLSISCEIDDSATSQDGYKIKMFSGLNRFGSTTNANGDSFYIRSNPESNSLDFMKIEANGNTTITDITNALLNEINGELLSGFTMFDYNNSIIAVSEEFFDTNDKAVIYMRFDYNGNLQNFQTVDQIVTDRSSNIRVKQHDNGFYFFYKPLDEDTFYLKSFDFEANLIDDIAMNTQQLASDIGANYSDVTYENQSIYFIGNFPERQFIVGYDNANNLITSKFWNETLENPWSINLAFMQNKMIRYYYEDNDFDYGNGVFEVYSMNGELLNSTTSQQVLVYYNLNSSGHLMYVAYDFFDSKDLDLVVLDSNLDVIYTKNFGGDNSADDGGNSLIYAIYETANVYTVFGQTTTRNNGDFNLPQNTGSFDEFMGIFDKF